MAVRTKAQRAERDEALERLRQWVKPGGTLYTILRHTSTSGMMRSISVLSINNGNPDAEYHYQRDPQIGWLSYSIAKVLDYTFDEEREAVKIRGCGMDMGFALINALSSTLYRDGFECPGAGCPSNDHSNGDRDYTPHHHESGGYALSHRWL